MLMIKWQEEVSKLISATLGERDREIIRLYYGLDKECLTWEDISKRYVFNLKPLDPLLHHHQLRSLNRLLATCRIGLSRERVRQVGLVALEKLKHAARKRKMEAMLLKN